MSVYKSNGINGICHRRGNCTYATRYMSHDWLLVHVWLRNFITRPPRGITKLLMNSLVSSNFGRDRVNHETPQYETHAIIIRYVCVSMKKKYSLFDYIFILRVLVSHGQNTRWNHLDGFQCNRSTDIVRELMCFPVRFPSDFHARPYEKKFLITKMYIFLRFVRRSTFTDACFIVRGRLPAVIIHSKTITVRTYKHAWQISCRRRRRAVRTSRT